MYLLAWIIHLARPETSDAMRSMAAWALHLRLGQGAVFHQHGVVECLRLP